MSDFQIEVVRASGRAPLKPFVNVYRVRGVQVSAVEYHAARNFQGLLLSKPVPFRAFNSVVCALAAAGFGASEVES